MPRLDLVTTSLVLFSSVLAAQNKLCSAALELGGSGAHVEVADHADLQPANACTYEAWFYATGIKGRIVSKGDGLSASSNRSFDMTYGSNSKVSAEFFLQGTTKREYVPLGDPAVTPLRQWTHVAATFDSAKQEAILYVGGKQVLKKATPAGATLYQSTKPLTIGGTPPWNDIWFRGQINQVRVWNVALSAAQITAFMMVESHSLPGITAAWPFDGHLFDLKGGHDGVAKQTITWVGGCATWTNYHAGSAGPFGIPSLTVDKKPAIGTTINVITDNASQAAATGVYVVGLKPLDVPFFGGKLLAEPVFLFTLPIGATGAQWPFSIPNNNSLPGIPVFTQLGAFYPNKTKPGLSAGLQMMLGN